MTTEHPVAEYEDACGCRMRIYADGRWHRTTPRTCTAYAKWLAWEHEPQLPKAAQHALVALPIADDDVGEALGWPLEDIAAVRAGRQRITVDDGLRWALAAGYTPKALFAEAAAYE